MADGFLQNLGRLAQTSRRGGDISGGGLLGTFLAGQDIERGELLKQQQLQQQAEALRGLGLPGVAQGAQTGLPLDQLVKLKELQGVQQRADQRRKLQEQAISGSGGGDRAVAQALLLDPQTAPLGQAQLADIRAREQEQRTLEKEERAQQKEKAKEKRIAQVSGFQFQEGITPSTTDANKLKEATIVAKQINTSLDRIDKIMEDVGTEAFDIFGTESADLSRERQKIIVLQNKLAGLGALAGQDLAILESIVPDPTAFGTRGSVVSRQLKDFRDIVNSDVNSIASAVGFKPKGEMSREQKLNRLNELRAKAGL